MSTEVSHLELRVTSDGYVTAENRFGAAAKSAEVFERALNKLEAQQIRAEKAAERQAAAVARAAEREAEAAERSAERKMAAAERAAERQERQYEREFAALLRRESAANAAYERDFANLVKTEQRKAEAAERAARRESERWNNAIQKALARYDREAEAAERTASRKAAAAERATAKENEQWNDQKQKAIARYEREAEAAEKAALRKAEADKRGGVGAGLMQGAGLGMLAGGAAGIAASITGSVIGGVKDFAGDLMHVTREFDKLNASLLTVTGSSKEAGRVFGVLQDFAAKTPYNLEQSVNAFVQLKNLGLDATERSLKAFGDMAAAFGDSMDHMLLAVGDAVMGINRPLKQFGINAEDASGKSKKFGSEVDKVSFNFRGHTTEVEKSAKAIQDYLISLSETNFSSAMENRLKTLDGQLSNVEDNWHRFELAIMQSGLEDALTGVASKLAEILQTMSELAKKYTKPALSGIKSVASSMLGAVPLVGPAALAAADSYHPGRIITDEMMQQEKDRLAKHAADTSKLTQEKDLAEYRSLVKHLKTRRELIEEEYKAEKALLEKEVSGNDQLDAELYAKARDKYEKAIKSLEKKGKPKEFELRSADEDAEFNYSERVSKAYASALESAKKSLAKQEDSERKSYEDRKAVLEEYTGPDQAELLARNEELWGKHLDKLAETSAKHEAERRVRHDSAMSALQRGDEKILAEVLTQESEYAKLVANKVLTEQEFTQLKVHLHTEANRKIYESNLEHMQQLTQMSGAMFGNLATAAENWGGKTSSVYKGMFAAQKSFAVASTMVAMYQDIAKAESEGGPYAGPIIALSVAGRFAQILSQLSSANYSGAFDKGGRIPAGGIGLVGEYGPEFVRGPAVVTSRADTARMMSDGFGGGGQAPINITVVNSRDGRSNSYRASSAREKVLVADARKNKSAMQRVVGG